MSPSQTTSASERAYAHLKRGILERSLPGGALVTEGDVAAELACSRTPVREALLRLEAEGLLTLLPKRGALVVPVSPDEVEDVLEARALVEEHAARTATADAQRAAHLAEVLAGHLDAMRAAAAEQDAWAFAGADRAFHAAVVGAGGNAVLTAFYDRLRDRQMRMGVTSLQGRPARMDLALREHAGVLDALRAGDLAGFRDRSSQHVRSAGAVLRAPRQLP